MTETLERDFYRRPTDGVARDLLGMVLVHDTLEGRTSGRIVETEAYFGPGDPASHAYRGPTPRSAIMFGHPGFAYVYFAYGMYHLLNAVTEDHGTAGAVLIRALEPIEGVGFMSERHERWRLADGPGKLTIAMGIDLHDNGRDLTAGELRIVRGRPIEDELVGVSTRVGIRAGTEYELRFYRKGDPHVSKARPARCTKPRT